MNEVGVVLDSNAVRYFLTYKKNPEALKNPAHVKIAEFVEKYAYVVRFYLPEIARIEAIKHMAKDMTSETKAVLAALRPFGRIIDRDIFQKAGELAFKCKMSGQGRGAVDLIIAVQAKNRSMTVLTADPHFLVIAEQCGLKILDLTS